MLCQKATRERERRQSGLNAAPCIPASLLSLAPSWWKLSSTSSFDFVERLQWDCGDDPSSSFFPPPCVAVW